MFANILPKISNLIQYQLPNVLFKSNIHSITSSIVTPSVSNPGGAWSTILSRTIIRNNFPRPKEGKRIKVHGWVKRMSTPEGRRIIMRRILKGRHALSH